MAGGEKRNCTIYVKHQLRLRMSRCRNASGCTSTLIKQKFSLMMIMMVKFNHLVHGVTTCSGNKRPMKNSLRSFIIVLLHYIFQTDAIQKLLITGFLY